MSDVPGLAQESGGQETPREVRSGLDRPGVGARKAVWGLVVVMAILFWDFWFWDDARLWLGFLPTGLAYHALYSLVIAATWALVVKFAWPEHLEEWAEEGDA